LFRVIRDYLQYRRQSVNQYGLHSPFMYRFYLDVVRNRKKGKVQEIENLRKQLKKNKTIIEVTDLGAGSRRNSTNKRKIADIVKHASVSEKQGRILRRIVDVYALENILELGTSLGLGTAYLSGQSSNVKVTTIEGCPETAKIAQNNFEQLSIQNVVQKVGAFDEVLTHLDGVTFDLIYMDGNHRLAPTLKYFEWAVEHLSEEGFIILDDINWSKEMIEAWERIKADKRLNVSMDLFRFGILSKREGQRKQNFVLKY
jgi:predicted O-methyltransferase YrrM